MEKDESDGYFRATVDLADGIYHYQFKGETIRLPSNRERRMISIVQTKSWFEQEPEPALLTDDDEEFKDMSKIDTGHIDSMEELLFSSRRKTTKSGGA